MPRAHSTLHSVISSSATPDECYTKDAKRERTSGTTAFAPLSHVDMFMWAHLNTVLALNTSVLEEVCGFDDDEEGGLDRVKWHLVTAAVLSARFDRKQPRLPWAWGIPRSHLANRWLCHGVP